MAQRKSLTLRDHQRTNPTMARKPNLAATLNALHLAARGGDPAAAFALARYAMRCRYRTAGKSNP